jgi:hypothetical protein
MGRVALIVFILTACRAAPVRTPEPVRAELRADAPVCVDAAALDAAVTRVLAEHHAELSGLVVDVRAAPTDSGADVTLRVLGHNGDVGLDRRYALSTNDCASAVPLVALAVDRWLTAFPEWAEPPAPPMPPAARWLAATLEGTASASAPPIGADGEVGGFGDWGGSHDRFGAGLVARTGIPRDAGDGRVRVISALAAATWRRRTGLWEMRAELRAGTLRANGLGFSSDHSDWLPWWEVALFGGRSFEWGALGIALAATPLRDHAVTTEGQVSVDIPFFHIGISGTFELVGE